MYMCIYIYVYVLLEYSNSNWLKERTHVLYVLQIRLKSCAFVKITIYIL